MTEKLTLNADARKWLRKNEACKGGYKWASQNCATLAEVVETGRPDWVIWTMTRPGVLADRELWLFACWCAEQVIPAWCAFSPNDHRPRQAIDARRGWLDGSVSDESLEAAWSAAWSASSASSPASWSASWSAAASAASSASWSAASSAASSTASTAASAASAASSLAASSAAWSAASASPAALSAALSATSAAAAVASQRDWLLANTAPAFVDGSRIGAAK